MNKPARRASSLSAKVGRPPASEISGRFGCKAKERYRYGCFWVGSPVHEVRAGQATTENDSAGGRNGEKKRVAEPRRKLEKKSKGHCTEYVGIFELSRRSAIYSNSSRKKNSLCTTPSYAHALYMSTCSARGSSARPKTSAQPIRSAQIQFCLQGSSALSSRLIQQGIAGVNW